MRLEAAASVERIKVERKEEGNGCDGEGKSESNRNRVSNVWVAKSDFMMMKRALLIYVSILQNGDQNKEGTTREPGIAKTGERKRR